MLYSCLGTRDARHLGVSAWFTDACLACTQSFAMFGGVYAFVSCLVQRIRNKQDGEALHVPRL